MKIGILYDAVYPWIRGGGEKHIHEIAIRLTERGHEVHLFGLQFWEGESDFIDNGIHYHGIAGGGELYDSGGRRSIGPPLRFALAMFFRLPRYDLGSFDVIDVIAFPFLSVPPFWLTRFVRFRQVPWVLTWLEVWGRRYWMRYMGVSGLLGAVAEKVTSLLATNHLCISITTQNRLVNLLGVPSRRITVIPRGYEVSEVTRRATQKRPHHVVYAGRLQPNKRISLVIRAWRSVVEAIPSAILSILGEGPELSSLMSEAEQTGVCENIRFLGRLDDAEFQKEIQQASLLVQPSEREGQSLIVPEAIAMGTLTLVAVGPDTAAADPFIDDSILEKALVIPTSAEHETWSARIVELLRDEERSLELLDRASNRVLEFDWEQSIIPKLESYYRSIVDSRRT